MKQILILGAGTAGATMVNRLRTPGLRGKINVTVVESEPSHFYQPGFLFLPFGVYRPSDIKRPIKSPFPQGTNFVQGEAELIEPGRCMVKLRDGRTLPYDYLIIATGCTPRPEETEGLLGDCWGTRHFEFYTFGGACRLAKFLESWKGGRLVINVAEMPIKCPVAPIEFAFLADWWFTKRGMRKDVEIELVTPLEGAFTRPICSNVLGHLLEEKHISLTTEFSIASVDASAQQITDWEGRSVAYDCLVAIPPNLGADVIARSGLADDLNFVPTDKHTLQAKAHENIFVLGDATDLPSSKAGSVAHFQAELLTENIEHAVKGQPLSASFDGHTNCFIETGYNKAVLVDFNYDTEPLPGKYPVPAIGPFTLLGESYVNHWGKMAFHPMYWNLLVKGRSMLVGNKMSMAGKHLVSGRSGA